MAGVVGADARSAAAAPARRRPEIDLLKGACIVGVVLIHSQPLLGTEFHVHVVNRAVPVFLVLFGLTSELWWNARAPHASPLGAWYGARLRRLMIPLWGALIVWWTAVLVFQAPTPVGLWRVIETFFGYLAPLRGGWFVTLILQLVIAFPALHWIVARVGALPTVVACALIAIASHTYMFEVIGLMRSLLLDKSAHPEALDLFYFFWIFAPAYFVLVVAGIALARHPSHDRAQLAAGGAAAFVIGSVIVRVVAPRTAFGNGLMSLLDIPLTVSLLGICSWVDASRLPARMLAWWGAASWGMYLGQMLIHDGVHLFGIRPEGGPVVLRWAYGAFLLAAASVLVIAGERVRLRVARVLSAGRAHATDAGASGATADRDRG